MFKDLWRDKIFWSKLLGLAMPIALQSLMLASVAAADALMLGALDQNAMSAVSLATQVQFIQNMVLAGIVSTVGILGAQYWGKGDKKAIDDLFGIALRLAGLVSIVFFLLCFLCPDELMFIFTNEEELIEIGAGYLRIAAFSYLLTGISQCYLAMMKITEHAATTALISIGTVFLNIGLNAILIFGLLGAPRMEARGAAMATLISRIVEVAWVILLSMKDSYVRPKIRLLFVVNKLLQKDFLACALPLFGASMLWGVGFTSYSAFMGHLGTDAVAANSVAAVVRDLVCCLCNGLGAGTGIVIGNELGQGKLERGKLYGDRLVVVAFLTGFLSTIIMLILTPVIMGFVRLTDGARSYLLGMMIIMAFYMIGRSVNTIMINGIFDAGGDTVFDMYSLAVMMWCLAVPLAALGTFVFDWPVLVVYACTCLDEVGKIPWVLLHYKKYKWVRDLTR